ncbi:MAG: adenylate/guanylate cyclase domain-containing protein, partial [Deltaproteobacteria bacterium]|nr:adenylate/guanylate cyclase domain-containing protein [Deltaproteobacteria bacterium]
LVEFSSVVNAVQCAQHIQAQLRTYNAEQEKDEQIHIRIGIHEGDIIAQPNGDVLGDGVNIASRLQTLAEPDTICISQKVYEEVDKKLTLGTVVSLGRPRLKNIAQRFPVYALLPEHPNGFRHTLRVQRLKLKRRVGTTHLARAALIVVGLLIGGGTVTFWFPFLLPFRILQSSIRNQEALPLPDKPSIVVLPFVNMSQDPEQEYFSDGMTEELITALSRLPGLFIISRNSAFTYKGKATKVQEISRELGVQYVLEGSVRKADNRVRITAQLVDATRDHHLWSERYERPLQDIFVLQDEIVQKIVTTLKLQLTLREQGILIRKTTDNLEAYDYYLRGAELHQRHTKEANMQARQMSERAIELDPQYAAAYAGLGATYFREWVDQWSQDPQTLEQFFTLEQKAIALDDSLPVAHTLLGWAYVWKKQHDQAIAEGERAIALDSNNADSYVALAEVLNLAGRPQEALGLVEKAMRLNPHYPFWYSFELGVTYGQMGRYEEAIAALKRCLTRSPNFLPAHVALAGNYSRLGRDEEARAEAAEVLRLNPNFSVEVWGQRVPVKDQARLERYLAALRKAGLK